MMIHVLFYIALFSEAKTAVKVQGIVNQPARNETGCIQKDNAWQKTLKVVFPINRNPDMRKKQIKTFVSFLLTNHP